MGERDLFDYHEPARTITVEYPTTVRFRVDRNVYNTTNNLGAFKFYNLSSDAQAYLWKDEFDQKKYIKMEFKAGYGNNMPLVFAGEIIKCYTYRESGSTEWITDIEANNLTAFYQFGFANEVIAKDTSFNNVIKQLFKMAPNCSIGYITNEAQPLAQDTTFTGQPLELLSQDYSNYQIFIDNGKINVLAENDVIPADSVHVITANSGLLGSPKRNNTILEVQTIFEPGIAMGQEIQLLSDTLAFMNGKYKVLAITHQGTISGTTCEKVITTLSLFLGVGLFNQLSDSSVPEVKTGAQVGWIRPVVHPISSPFSNARLHPIYQTVKPHNGVDYSSPFGTPVRAAHSGVVYAIKSTNQSGGYGNLIVIANDDNLHVTQYYAHLSRVDVSEKQRVEAGKIIGAVGNTGRSTGPHLHFEIRINGQPTNPVNYVGS